VIVFVAGGGSMTSSPAGRTTQHRSPSGLGGGSVTQEEPAGLAARRRLAVDQNEEARREDALSENP
jgi:hypothetical protein